MQCKSPTQPLCRTCAKPIRKDAKTIYVGDDRWHRRAGGRRHGPRRWGWRRVVISGDGRKIERGAGRAAAGSTNRPAIASLLGRGDRRLIAENAWRALCSRML